MWINRTLLRLLTDKKQFEKLNGNIVLDRFDKEERALINQLRKHWKAHETFDMETFAQKFFLDVPCDVPEVEFYRKIFLSMNETPDPNIAKNMIRDLRTMEFNKEVESLQTEYQTGGEVDLFEGIRKLSQDFEHDIKKSASQEYCTADVQEIVEDASAGSSLGWKLRCLNDSMPHSGTGNQIILGMRPGKGKTSFVADNGVYWLQRLRKIGKPRPICYFNNEGHMIKIKGSFLRAALGKTLEEIKKIGWGKANKEFYEILGGEDMLRIYNSHRLTNVQMERIIERDNPGVVIFDMIGNIHMQGRQNDRQDLALEAKYQWARECAVAYDFLSIGVCQVSAKGLDPKTGKPLQYIPDNALKDSQTAIQGACDAIITIGCKDEPGFEKSRFINIPKIFKGATSPGANPACRSQVIFEGDICRYYDAKTV